MTIDTSSRLPPTPYAPPKVSWEDFHDWSLRQEHRVEWVDGEIIELMPPSIRHQLIIRLLVFVMGLHAERNGLGMVVQDVQMRLRSRPSGRVPDIVFVAREHESRVMLTYVDGPVDLAVEVVSPDSEIRDRKDKVTEYEAARVREYWLIDEPRHEALFYVLSGDGTYVEAPIDEDGVYTSTVLIGLRLRVDWLWRSPLPTFDEILAELPALNAGASEPGKPR